MCCFQDHLFQLYHNIIFCIYELVVVPLVCVLTIILSNSSTGAVVGKCYVMQLLFRHALFNLVALEVIAIMQYAQCAQYLTPSVIPRPHPAFCCLQYGVHVWREPGNKATYYLIHITSSIKPNTQCI